MLSVECEQCGAHYEQWGDLEAGSATDTPVSARCAQCGAEIPSGDSESEAQAFLEADFPEMPAEEITDPRPATEEASSQEALSEFTGNVRPALDARASEELNDPIVLGMSAEGELLGSALADETDTQVDLTPSSRVTTVPSRVSEIPIESRDFITDDPQPKAKRRGALQPTPAPRTTLNGVTKSFGTPTLAALVERKERSLPQAEADAFPELFPELKPRDKRPPDIRVDNHVPAVPPLNSASRPSIAPLLRPATSDAPVAHPSLPARRSSSTGSFVLFGMVLAAAGMLFARFTSTDRAREVASLPTEPVLNGQQSPTPRPRPETDKAHAAANSIGAEGSPEHSALESTLSPDPPPQPADPAIPTRPSLSRAQKLGSPSDGLQAVEEEPTVENTEQAPPALTAFDAKAAGSALEQAAQRANGCRKPGDLSGQAVVVLTFAPSGRVTTANVSGPPFAGTETGGCIASTLRETRVPPFNGEFITVKKTVLIQ